MKKKRLLLLPIQMTETIKPITPLPEQWSPVPVWPIEGGGQLKKNSKPGDNPKCKYLIKQSKPIACDDPVLVTKVSFLNWIKKEDVRRDPLLEEYRPRYNLPIPHHHYHLQLFYQA